MAFPSSLHALAIGPLAIGPLAIGIGALAFGASAPAAPAPAARSTPSEAPKLVRSIALPGIEGRLDHLALDAKRGRLFVAALAEGRIEVVDLARGAPAPSLPGISRPQGVLYLPGADRLLVTGGGDGKLVLFDGASLERLADLDVGLDADELAFDERRGHVLVGAGTGALVFVDLAAWTIVGRAELEGHPEAFAIDASGARAFVNVPSKNEIALVDLEARVKTAAWPLPEGLTANFPLGVAPDDGAVLVGCRTPGKLLVVDPASGAGTAAGGDIGAQADGLFVVDGGARVLVTTGAGFLEIFERGPDRAFAKTLSAPTASGARTGVLDPEARKLYLAVPHRGGQAAEIREYDLGPAAPLPPVGGEPGGK